MENESIKVNDQFKIIFSIVKEVSEDNIPHASDYGISDDKFADLLEITQEAHLIKNVKVLRGGRGNVVQSLIKVAWDMSMSQYIMKNNKDGSVAQSWAKL